MSQINQNTTVNIDLSAYTTIILSDFKLLTHKSKILMYTTKQGVQYFKSGTMDSKEEESLPKMFR